MASQAYYDWINAGSPYVRARPTLEFRDLLRSHGYVVYDYPNGVHLTAVPPEDHTPFSATGWPITSARWVGHADDVMPDGTIPVPLPKLARQIIADKDAGVLGTKWIKYINWTDEDGNCWHTSWQSDKKTVSSTDKGHIHISGRSDMDTSDEVSASGWDPVARALGDDMSADDVVVGMSRLFDEAANRTTPTGRNFGNDFIKLLQDAGLRDLLAGKLAGDMAAKLDAILAAAEDDTNTTVTLPLDAVQALTDLKVAVAAVPKAVVDEEAGRLAS